MSSTVAPLVQEGMDTTDPEVAHDFLATTYANHTPLLSGDRDRFQCRVRVLREDRFGVERLQHTMALDTDVDPYGALLAIHVRHGSLRMAADDVEIRSVPGDVLLAGPSAEHHVQWDDLDIAILRLEVAAVEDIAAELTDTPAGRLRFALTTPIDQARAAHWLGAVHYLNTSVLDTPDVADNPLIRTQAFRTLAIAALNTFPNSTLTVGATGQPTVLERGALTRAIDFIEARAGDDITVGEIAAAAGVSPRTIQLAFRRHRDVTPMMYLRAVRLRRAHAELRSADSVETTITAVAHRWGFLHAGHFARLYRDEYDCHPLDTLRSD